MQGQLRWSWWGERERRLFYISEKQVADVAHIFWWIHRLLLPLVANMSGMLVLISGTPGGTLLLHQPLSSNLTASAAAASCKIPPQKKNIPRQQSHTHSTIRNVSPAALLRRLPSRSASLSRSLRASPAAPAADSPPFHLWDGGRIRYHADT